jgi:hypothetical protein
MMAKYKFLLTTCYLLTKEGGARQSDSTKENSLKWDILTCLFFSITMRMQWKDIRDSLQEKYRQYDTESFEASLSRELGRLIKTGYLKKDDMSHQEVYYYIPKRRQQKVVDGISKRFLYRKVDEFWQRFSLEQKKRIAKDLAFSHSMTLKVVQNFVNEMLGTFGGWANDRMVELNDPLQQKEDSSKYSAEEKAKLKVQLENLKNDCTKFQSNIAAENKFVIDNFKDLTELSFDFLNYVVDPIYEGNGFKAIRDLMQKAVEEQKEKIKKNNISS